MLLMQTRFKQGYGVLSRYNQREIRQQYVCQRFLRHIRHYRHGLKAEITDPPFEIRVKIRVNSVWIYY